MSDVVQVPVGLLKKVFKVAVLAAVVFALVFGYRFERGFAKDYQRMHDENTMMWRYLTQAMDMPDGKRIARADLIEQMLKERFSLVKK